MLLPLVTLYFLDLTFHNDPRLYLVEVELQTHDVYAHIGEQILRFGISSEMTKYKIKSALIDEINKDDAKYKKVYQKKKTMQALFQKRPKKV